MQKNEILVAVVPEPLAQIINHLFEEQRDCHVKHVQERTFLVDEVSRLQPDLVIANLHLLGSEAAKIISEMKLSSPHSKIFIINFSHDLGRQARKWGADAYLDEEHLVRQLLPKVQQLLGRSSLMRKSS